ncbi:dihydrofolate reductase family protein [Intrasporangium flavum]|uniref:dihydrofolate reductase family protein n=1 Tax=Intrasporangium flavum TaxID=1428657 RepID=UPI00096BEC8D|nr:dihydrofolate reductase family protein [Intrasporangium flavum]
MNRIIVWMQASADGFTSGPNGEFDWADVGTELHTHFVTTLADAGLFVYGREVFDMMASFWPIADTLPDSTPNQMAYARIWRPMPKAVLSTTRETAGWNSTVLPSTQGLRALVDDADGDAYVFGGSRTVAALEEADLVDEYQVFVHPVLLGGGASFHAVDGRRALRLAEARTFDGRVVGLRHVRERDAS